MCEGDDEKLWKISFLMKFSVDEDAFLCVDRKKLNYEFLAVVKIFRQTFAGSLFYPFTALMSLSSITRPETSVPDTRVFEPIFFVFLFNF